MWRRDNGGSVMAGSIKRGEITANVSSEGGINRRRA